MRRFIPGGTRALQALAILLALAQVQADAASKKKEPPPPKTDETVGDLAFVPQAGETKVEGVGLVSNLENTGVDPPPSWYRTQLVEEMGKAMIDHPNKILADPRFAMVVVRMTIRTGASPEDRFDVEVEVPPACGTKSLAGGYLMMTRLREVMVAGGSPRTSQDLALAQGPVMIGNEKDPNNPKVGRVLGGGKVKKETPFTLVIMENRRSFRTAKMLETVINARFHQSEAGTQKGAATGKTDGHLTLKVPTTYHQNQLRFFRVVQLLPMIDTPELRERRMAAWGKELLDPKTSGVAAMKLEGLGPSAGEVLRQGLKSDNAQVRFFSGESLAYLDDPSGADALGDTAAKMPQFRAYALAALAAMDQNASHMKLRKLMDEPDVEVRYGAFNALRTLDPNDPALGRVGILDQPRKEEDEADEEAPDAMAVALASASQRARPEDPFALYIVDSEGPPMVHVSRSRRSEIVVFGRDQKLLPPIVLGTGAILLNASDNNEEVEISKIVPSRGGDSDLKYRTSLDVGEVVRRVSNLGASYPEVVAILEAANRQKNLPGSLAIDAVPVTTPAYFEAAILGKDSTKPDKAVKQASAKAEKPASRLRRLLRLGRGDDGEGDATAASVDKDKGKGKDADATASASPKAPGAGADADKAGSGPAAKKDPSVQKAGTEAEAGADDGDGPSSRPRLFNLFRRRPSGGS
ncbi:flagellar basal body P-ring protein [Aquisphaera giovannonii]|uniref:Flagellar basal body P-ring protein n=1 Tax=Aquisphaera giovannonii TaxID=406548 RepID=A0A5B9W389_9BACT|nr:flagellar basal body P-ring protein FlgI [Aquisphaera giovannonii]QEH35058.1 flagellar basal body P-ring protein [Aquisphaera giovannonii]